MSVTNGLLLLVLAATSLVMWRRLRAHLRESHIREFELPRGLFEQLRKRRPELTTKECQLVAHALRQFFLAYLKSGRKYVSMPSQIVDDLWHEFILHTKAYQEFCRKAFGAFFHHTPAVALEKNQDANAGLRRCFWFTCREENINPRRPTRLPLLFALDAKLNIPDGFRYIADCSSISRVQPNSSSSGVVYCGGDFGSSSFDGTTNGFGDAGGFGATSSDSLGSSAGDSVGDSSGCGGGGCGGGGGE